MSYLNIGPHTIHHGDSRDVLAAMPDNCVDAVVTDPPYALVSIVKRFGQPGAAPAKGNDAYARASAGFMGQSWDTGEVAFATEFWAQVLRVLKPGGHVVAFSGTRTYHRLAVAIEDSGFEIRDQLAWVYGSGFPKSHDVSKAIDKAAGVEREVVGPDPNAARRNKTTSKFSGVYGEIEDAITCPLTAPATPQAQQWEGWGTALKPAWEPIVLARKPLRSLDTNVLEIVQSQLEELGVSGDFTWKDGSAKDAASLKIMTNLWLTDQQQAAETSVGSAGGNEKRRTDSPTRRNTETHGTDGAKLTPGEQESTRVKQTLDSENKFCPHTAENASAAGNKRTAFSPSTTSTAAEQSTEKKPTAKFMPNCAETGIPKAIGFFAGIATGLTGSMERVHIRLDDDGGLVWPHGVPKFVSGGALTVAANVLEHGTGAINIDGCRVEGEPWKPHRASGLGSVKFFSEGNAAVIDKEPHASGRFPANILHDGEQFGENGRYFYSPKASKKDRGEGNIHPTVKPTDLMAYLCRLVTPPGGVVLDPFMGSGSTGKGAHAEGFRFIGIEREENFFEIAAARLMDLT